MMAKIAIVEDDESIAQMYKAELDSAGYQTALAANGKEGLELCEKWRPDMVLLDWRMPVMTGQEMLKELRKTDWGKKAIVVAMTNLSQQETNVSMGKDGFDDYAVKVYYTPKMLREKIDGLFSQDSKPKE